MQQYDEIAVYERSGFEVIVDKTWEDISVSQLFDDSEHDITEICQKIDACEYDWFMLRVRVMLDGHEMGSHYLGGCLYEDARDVLADGTAEDCITMAMEEAQTEVSRLRGRLAELETA
jgi:hypothetical protein